MEFWTRKKGFAVLRRGPLLFGKIHVYPMSHKLATTIVIQELKVSYNASEWETVRKLKS